MKDGISTLAPHFCRMASGWRLLIFVTRAAVWWEYKVPAFLAVAYLTAYAQGVSFGELLPRLGVVLAALSAVASFASILNDLMDVEDDARAQKPNRMAARTMRFKTAALAACLTAGVLCAWLLRESPAALVMYGANWVVFALYSMPPLRWKKRGIVGVLADASGGQALPSLWSCVYVAAASPRALDASLLVPLGVWAGALGFRGILSHQLLDLPNDRVTKVRTLAVRLGAERVGRWVACLVFPVELLGLVALLVRVAAPLTWPFLAVHFLLVWQMADRLNIKPVLVRPAASYRFLLFKYYVTFFPVTFILALAQGTRAALGLVIFHAAAFPDAWRRFPHHVRGILRHHRQEVQTAGLAKTARITEAIRRGLRFLSMAQRQDGEFETLLDSDESLKRGIPDSSPFSTALVAYSLKSCLPASRPLIDRALDFLEAHMEEGGAWRYYTSEAFKHTRIPPDLDDTACASYVLSSQRGRAPLNQWIFLSNRNGEGLFCTWLLPESSRSDEFLHYLARLESAAVSRTPPMPPEFKGSGRFHSPKDPVNASEVDSVVNANVLLYLGETAETRPVIDYLVRLIQSNSEDGSSFYYNDVMALYYMLARATLESAPTMRTVAGTVTKRITGRLKVSATTMPPLLLALAACALLTFEPKSPILPTVIGLLVKTQQDDGSWPRHTFYRGPAEFWGSEELTTGFCLEALARYAALRA